ncbi:MAG: hypothetical protein LUQ44_05190 [Methanothrix sp.]|nr:hypothetical protein [Methanothrix sp.]
MQHDDGSKVLVAVDVPADPDEIRQVGVLNFFKGKPESVDKNFNVLSEMILRYSKPIVTSFEQLGTEKVPLQKATAEFGLSFTGTGNIYLVETTAGANIKVSLEWSLKG